MAVGLARPDTRPDADVVLYDGRCQFCLARVQQLAWLDAGGERLAFLSLHDPDVAERYPGVDPGRLLDEMCVVDRDGGHHWGADAVRYLSRRIPRLWWLAPLMHLPGAMLVARPVYAWVSRNRYRIAGRSDDCVDGACSVHR